MSQARFFRFRILENEYSRYGKPLYGFMVAPVVNKGHDLIGVSFHMDGTSFHCQIDYSDISEREVSAEEFLSNFPTVDPKDN